MNVAALYGQFSEWSTFSSQVQKSMLIIRGNDGADKLAVAGAAMPQVSAEVIDAASMRKENAEHVQQMMVAILKARFLAESQERHDAECPDRGSEMGDCIEVLPDNVPVADIEDCMELNILDDDFDLGPNILT